MDLAGTMVNDDIFREKNRLRQLCAKRRRNLSLREMAEMSALITQKLIQLPAYREADTVFAYMSLPGEVQMSAFLDRCRADGKNTALPVIMEDGIHFFRVEAGDILKEGSMHIMEPDPEKAEGMDDRTDALIIVPGVAFDRSGGRLGYGKGYYDQYLTKYKNHPTVACAYHFQIFDRLPVEKGDVPVDLLITD